MAVNSFAKELQKIAQEEVVKEAQFYSRSIIENLKLERLRKQYLETQAKREAVASTTSSVIKVKGFEQWRSLNARQEGDRRPDAELKVAELEKKLEEKTAKINAIRAKIDDFSNKVKGLEFKIEAEAGQSQLRDRALHQQQYDDQMAVHRQMQLDAAAWTVQRNEQQNTLAALAQGQGVLAGAIGQVSSQVQALGSQVQGIQDLDPGRAVQDQTRMAD